MAGRRRTATVLRLPRPIQRQSRRGQAVRRGAGHSGDPGPGVRGDRSEPVPASLRPSTPPLRDWIERWLAIKIDVAPATHVEYTRILRGRITADLGDLRIAEISRHEHLNPWKAALSRQLMPTGVRKHRTVLSQVMRDAVPHVRSDDPLRMPAGHRGNGLPQLNPTPRACSPASRSMVLARCREPLHDLVVVALGTGMRAGELFGLRARRRPSGRMAGDRCRTDAAPRRHFRRAEDIAVTAHDHVDDGTAVVLPV